MPLAEAAERCNISLSTLAQAAREGRLPAFFVTLDLRSAGTQLAHYAQLVFWNWRRQ